MRYTKSCCPEGDEEVHFYECIDQQWVLEMIECMPSWRCPLLP
jgi:hypothetical protein